MKNWLSPVCWMLIHWYDVYHNKLQTENQIPFTNQCLYTEPSYGPLIKYAMRYQLSENSIEYIEHEICPPAMTYILIPCVSKTALDQYVKGTLNCRFSFLFFPPRIMTISIKLCIHIRAHLRNTLIVLNEV